MLDGPREPWRHLQSRTVPAGVPWTSRVRVVGALVAACALLFAATEGQSEPGSDPSRSTAGIDGDDEALADRSPAEVANAYAWCPPLPQSARDLAQKNPGMFQVRRGFGDKLTRLRENRRLREEGRLSGTPEEIQGLTAVSGVIRIPVLLGYYADTFFLDYTRQQYQKMLFDGPFPTGTMAEYYDEVSYSSLAVAGTVSDWFQVSQPGPYYYGTTNGLDPDSSHTHQFIHEVLAGRDGQIDFRLYDNDGMDGVANSGDDDGYVDFIAMVHYDRGGETGGPGILSHHWSLSGGPLGIYTTNDPAAGGGFIKIDDYAIMPGLAPDGDIIEISIFCHEFGHAFKLLDLYDNDSITGPSAGIGSWGIMGAGTWDHPESPPHYCAWSKVELGWINPGVVANDLLAWPLASSSLTPTAMRLWAGGASDTPEYFLVEYRTKDGFDQYLPGPGVLIWHVNENSNLPPGRVLNFDETHKRLDLECADQSGFDHVINADDLDWYGLGDLGNLGDARDPFCDGDFFGANPQTSLPSSIAYNGSQTGVQVRVNTPCGPPEILTDLIVGQQGPGVNLCIRDCTTDVCTAPSPCDVWWGSPDIYINNDGDGEIDAPAKGLVNRFWTVVRNTGVDPASSVQVDFYVQDPGMGLIWPGQALHVATQHIPIIPAGGSELVSFEWLLVSPPPGVEHYCFGVVVSHPDDPPVSQVVVNDSNVAQVNIQELYAKAGDTPPTATANECDGSLHGLARSGSSSGAGAGGRDELVADFTLNICNFVNAPQCDFSVRIGSPPLYDDAVIPPDWDVILSITDGVLGYDQCLPLQVTVIDHDAHHLDYAYVPLTLLCGGVPIGGELIEVHVDNFAPFPLCDQFSVVAEFPPGSDDHPLENFVEVRWDKTALDEGGWPEEVERWRLHRGSTPNFVPLATNLITETCLDEDTETPRFDNFVDYPADQAERYYKLVSVDRAGNASVSCATEIEVSSPSGVPTAEASGDGPVLSRPVPNPMSTETQVSFTVPGDGGEVLIEVFDTHGRRVAALVHGRLPGGRHQVAWNGKDEADQEVPAGVYFVRLRANGGEESRKITVRR